METEPIMLTVEQAAGLCQIGRDRMYLLTRRQDFPALRFGKSIRIPRQKLQEWVEQHAGEALEA